MAAGGHVDTDTRIVREPNPPTKASQPSNDFQFAKRSAYAVNYQFESDETWAEETSETHITTNVLGWLVEIGLFKKLGRGRYKISTALYKYWNNRNVNELDVEDALTRSLTTT